MATNAIPPIGPEGAAAAAGQVASSAPALAAGAGVVGGWVLPRQAARCLRFIAEHPGSSSTQVQAGVGIRHPSQASNVLARLERDGLAHTDRGRRALNAWELTERGLALLAAQPEGIYE